MCCTQFIFIRGVAFLPALFLKHSGTICDRSQSVYLSFDMTFKVVTVDVTECAPGLSHSNVAVEQYRHPLIPYVPGIRIK
ncbi:MAG: hypothetical protein ACI9BW_004314 [Gammaproteobacteria bacterium]|jgi:hypothetical protein